MMGWVASVAEVLYGQSDIVRDRPDPEPVSDREREEPPTPQDTEAGGGS